jgi:hypothetical protein
MKTRLKFLELTKNEDSKYDGYFKVVYTGILNLNDSDIQFLYSEEEGMGVELKIKENDEYELVNREDKFEYLFIEELFSQSPINFDDITIGEEIELNFDYYEDDGIIEF